MRTRDDQLLHLFLPRSPHWSRSVLPGITEFVRRETPWSVLNHGEATVVEALRRARPAPAAFVGYVGTEGGLSDWLRDWGGPAINLGGRHRPSGLVSVVHDDEAIGRMAAEHLLEARERRYAFLGLGRNRISEGRFQGFRERLLEAGRKRRK